jgi:hypothetical protein
MAEAGTGGAASTGGAATTGAAATTGPDVVMGVPIITGIVGGFGLASPWERQRVVCDNKHSNKRADRDPSP